MWKGYHIVEHRAVACPSGRITAHDFLVYTLMQICKDAGASAQKERIIDIGQQSADIKLSAAAMDDPNGKGAIVCQALPGPVRTAYES